MLSVMRRAVGVLASLLAVQAAVAPAPAAAHGASIGGRGSVYHVSDDFSAKASRVVAYGRPDDVVLVGDWDGDGADTLAVRRGATYHVKDSIAGGAADTVVTYGRPGDTVLVGDWDGDGTDTFAVRRGATYHVKNSIAGGPADTVVTYGRPGDTVLVGDWDGDGADTLAVRRGATYHVKDSIAGGPADTVVTYGRPADLVMTGDWDGDGTDTFTVRRGATYFVKDSVAAGPADRVVVYGRAGDAALVGDFDGDGTDSLGVRRAAGSPGSPAPAPTPTATTGPRAAVGAPVVCPAGGTTVRTADQLRAALGSAKPGDVIRLGAGTYSAGTSASSRFVATGGGEEPIWLCGPRDAVLTTGSTSGGYALHLREAHNWRLVGFTVATALKGVMADRTTDTVIQGLRVKDIGHEGIHLRTHSSGNVVRDNEVSGTGTVVPRFGEGVYVGSAKSNWATYTGGAPDRSDRNLVVGNRIWGTRSESVDVKEGTTGGAVVGNSFDGAAVVVADGPDSWVAVKGNDWVFTDNTGVSAPRDGFQVTEELTGWGLRNVFTRNVAEVADVGGYAVRASAATRGSTVVWCDNTVRGGARSLSNVTCRP